MATPAPRDEFETLKLKAEIEKAQAERDKIQEELRQSKGVFVRLGKFFTPLVAGLSILLTYLAATYKSETAKAQLEKAQAELERKQVVLDKEIAERDLKAAKESLAMTQSAIAEANIEKKQAEEARNFTQQRLGQLQGEFASLKKEQGDRILFGNLRKLIDILDSEPPQNKIASSRYIEDIRREVAGDAGFKPERVSYLTTAGQDIGNKSDLRALLYYALFQATNDNQWLDQIRRLAADNAIDCSLSGCEFVPAFKSLMELKYFDSKDRAGLICDLYSRGATKFVFRSGIRFNELWGFNQALYSWDKAATARCRRPYLDQLERFRQSWERLGPASKRNLFIYTVNGDLLLAKKLDFAVPSWSNDSKIVDLPAQAVLMWYLDQNPSLDEQFEMRERQYALTFQHIPEDLFTALVSRSTNEWVKQHHKLVTAWAGTGLPDLTAASDTTMQKILFGVWITEADLP